jgi:hypothetical protein
MTGKSKATLGRYYSGYTEHSDRFTPIDAVINLEKAAGYPHVTSAHLGARKPSMKFSANRWSKFLYYCFKSKACKVNV